MKKFTTIIFVASTLIASASMAEGTDKKADNFAAHKSAVIANLNKEKAIVESSISCINSAKAKEDVKKCQDQRRDSMKALRENIKAQRKEHLGERKERLEEKSEKVNEKINKIDQKSPARTANTKTTK